MDFQMDHSFDEQQNRWNIILTGEIDIFNSLELKTRLTKLVEEKPADVFLQCKFLEYIDSTGLGALVGVLKNVKGSGFTIHMQDVKPNIQKLFKITNLDNEFILEEGDGNG
ncbi:MAG: STAS domain-containing protein [Defluviitaleaceae bacterium]|nr:STAS domain-containing protein [Defluviitaleaceae bacterium]